MGETGPSRRRFLGAASMFGALPSLASPAGAGPLSPGDLPDPQHPGRFQRALCLSGGGARGAYEAGIIEYLRLANGVSDGAPLAPYGLVSGTSIGALNGYFVATAQYSLLRNLWFGIAHQYIIVLKKRYADATDSDSGLGNRIAAAMRMAFSLAKDDTGVLDGAHLRAWMATYIDPRRKPVMPFVFPATNLTTQSAEFFYMVSEELSPDERARAAAAVQATVGPQAVLREATPNILIDCLRASAAIPIAFDPVVLPSADGTSTHHYVDGGVTANTPVGVARAAAHNVDIIMLDPAFQNQKYTSAFDIGIGVFGTMQRRMLEADVRAAYLESFGKAAVAGSTQISPDISKFAQQLYASNFFLMRPKEELSVNIVGFDDGPNIFNTYSTGYEDARRGFTPYAFEQREPGDFSPGSNPDPPRGGAGGTA